MQQPVAEDDVSVAKSLISNKIGGSADVEEAPIAVLLVGSGDVVGVEVEAQILDVRWQVGEDCSRPAASVNYLFAGADPPTVLGDPRPPVGSAHEVLR